MSHFPNDARIGEDLAARLDAVRGKALIAGGAGLAVGLVGALAFPSSFFPAYLAAFLLWAGVSFGAIGLCLLFHLAGGSWMVPLRRPFEAAGWQIVVMAALFLPIALGLKWTYAWTDPQVVDSVDLVAHKVNVIGYLTATNFLIRAAIYFAISAGVAAMVGGWSRRQDEAIGDGPTRRLNAASGPAMLVMFLTATFAAFDWGMSRDPDWFSSIYGAMYIIGSLLTTLALAAVFIVKVAPYEPVRSVQTPDRLNDLGNLLLTFTMLWAYFSFSQFVIAWLGNLPEEVVWYLRRTHGIWGALALALIAFGFFAPFLALLQRKHKRDTAWILPIAAWILVMRAVDGAWNILPGFAPIGSEAPGFPWISVAFYLASLVGIGGIWVAMFLRRLAASPMVPLRDPTILAALEHDRAHAAEPAGGPIR